MTVLDHLSGKTPQIRYGKDTQYDSRDGEIRLFFIACSVYATVEVRAIRKRVSSTVMMSFLVCCCRHFQDHKISHKNERRQIISFLMLQLCSSTYPLAALFAAEQHQLIVGCVPIKCELTFNVLSCFFHKM